MSTKKKVVSKGTKKESKFELPDYDQLEKGKDGYKSLSTVYDSEFKKFEEIGEEFEGKFVEVMQAGKRGEEKDCALFQEKKTNKKYLFGAYQILQAVNKYGTREYKIIFLGKEKIAGGRTVNKFDVRVK